jgi:hypothetical protein
MAVLWVREGTESLLDGAPHQSSKMFMYFVVNSDLTNIALNNELMLPVE